LASSTLLQIGAVAYYELRMQWRRRGLLVITLALLVTTVGPALVIRNDLSEMGSGDYSPLMVWLVWASLGSVLAFVLPLIFADTLPRDHQLHVRELLDTKPLPFSIYLTGKLLGALASAGVMLAVLAVAIGLFWSVFVGTIDPARFIGLWAGAASMAAINIGLIVVLTSFFKDSRAAIFAGIVFVVVLPLLTGFPPRGNFVEIFSALRPGLFFSYMTNAGMSLNYTPLSVEVTLISGFVQLLLAWLGALMVNRLLKGSQS
jgi:hypothetical protein